MGDDLVIHLDLLDCIRMKVKLEFFLGSFTQDQNTGNLDSTACTSGTGSDKHQKDQNRLGQSRPLVEVGARKTGRCDNGTYLECSLLECSHFRSGEDGLPPILLYHYTETRAKFHAASFLQGFSGYLETDGYQGYNNLPDIKRCSCWAHVRRYFTDAIPKGKEYDYSLPAVQGVQFCSKLFDCERYSKAKNHTAEQRKQFRLEKEKPILEAFWNWLDQQRPNKGTRLAKAVNYAQNRKDTLMTYLEDGHCSLSNNLSENAIRPFTVGRKNWLFSASPKGAASSAIMYTMVEMAKANDLNTYKYLTYLLSQRPDDKMSDEQLEQLAPWSETAKTNCQN